MKKIKILVTGGSGFIGSNLILMLLDLGYRVNCLDLKRPIKLKSKNLKFFKGTIFNEKIILKAMNKCNVVIHLAATLGVKNTDKNIIRCLDTNMNGTRKILDVAVKKKINKFIFSSSSEVYGEQKKFPIGEDAELKNKSIYAISKIAAEKYVIGYSQSYGLNFNIIRFFNVYGKGQKKNFVMPKFANSIKLARVLKVYGDGSQIRSFCNVVDAAQGVIKILQKGKKNQIYNVGNNNEPISIFNLAKKFVRISNKNIKVNKISYKKSDRKKSREIFKRYPNLNKIVKDTGYWPKINLNNGIKKLIS